MASEVKSIFLSASIPVPERDPKYYETADVIAIRDAVLALAISIIPKHKLVWGGHPSITPLINYVLEINKIDIQEHMTIYQSRFFEKHFPEDNNRFNNIMLIEKMRDRESSLKLMREQMINSEHFSAGIFIGGMEGVEEEYKMFTETHPNAIVIPLASTGAAAKVLFDKMSQEDRNIRFSKDYGYSSLFQKYLIEKL